MRNCQHVQKWWRLHNLNEEPEKKIWDCRLTVCIIYIPTKLLFLPNYNGLIISVLESDSASGVPCVASVLCQVNPCRSKVLKSKTKPPQSVSALLNHSSITE